MKSVQNILLDTSTFLLAGGRGSRLSPLTRRRSKPAVPFGDRCIIDFTLSNCLRSNLFGPHVITQYQAAHLTRHVRRWWLEQAASGAAVSSSPVCVPAPKPAYSGTADALFRNNIFLEMLGRDAQDPTSAHDIGRNILPNLVAEKNLYAFQFQGYWKDVGTLDSYYEANMEWLNALPSSHRLAGSGSVIADGARIHRTAEVIQSIVMAGVVIGPNARVRRAILDENVRVECGARIGYGDSARTISVIPANS